MVVRSMILSTVTDRRHGRHDMRHCRIDAASTVSITFAPGCLKMTNSTPGLPFCQAVNCVFSGPSTAWPMSPECVPARLCGRKR